MIYNNVKKLCSISGISIGTLEKVLGFSNGSICKWNENEPGVRKVQKVSDYLGVPIEQLLDGNENTLKTSIPESSTR